MKNLALTIWTAIRLIRLAIALFLFSQAYVTKNWIFIGIGLFFLLLVIFNFGCTPSGCAVPNNKYSKR